MAAVGGAEGQEDIRALVLGVLSGSIPHEVLKAREGDCRVLRARPVSGPTRVVKLWSRPGVAGWIRRLTRTSPGMRERDALRRLRRAGLAVPVPLGTTRLPPAAAPFTDALLLEDLGVCVSAADHVKELIALGRHAEVDRFIEAVVEMTAAMVDSGVVDRDHSFVNIVSTPEGRLARLDLEIAATGRTSLFRATAYGDMLGRLLASCTFAVQPDVERVTRFAELLVARMNPPARALARASARMDEMLQTQLRRTGIHSEVRLPWNER